MTTESFRLMRTGNRPLSFQGKRIAEATSEDHEASRWHEIELYRTEGGKWVAVVKFLTRWQGEDNRFSAEIFDDADSAIAWFRSHSPIDGLIGYPPGDVYEIKQHRLEKQLSQRYQTAISELFARVPEADERID
jgi:hypothetical protein